MNPENPLFILPCWIGLIFFLIGLIMTKNPPKKINWLIGYRTRSSMKSQERWDFAQIYSSKRMMNSGIILFIISLFGLILPIDEQAGVYISILLILGSLIYLIITTESEMKKKFGKD